MSVLRFGQERLNNLIKRHSGLFSGVQVLPRLSRYLDCRDFVVCHYPGLISQGHSYKESTVLWFYSTIELSAIATIEGGAWR